MKKNSPNKFPNDIIDIKFSGNQAYVLKEINLTSTQVEDQLKKLKYTGQNRKKLPSTENQKFPPFALAFFKLLFRKCEIPSEDELITFYKDNFFQSSLSGEIICKYEEEILKVDWESFTGRFLRSYPSLIRDYHFFLKCLESEYFDRVTYSLQDDYYEGIDITVSSENIKKQISLHTNTNRAKTYKSKKKNRHDYSKSDEIVIEIDLSTTSKKVSDFYLYPDEVLNNLIAKVEEEKHFYVVSKK